MTDVLRDLLDAFTRMPDAGLTRDDPRFAWWYETAAIRERARKALDSDREAALTAALRDLLDLIETLDAGEHDNEPTIANASSTGIGRNAGLVRRLSVRRSLKSPDKKVGGETNDRADRVPAPRDRAKGRALQPPLPDMRRAYRLRGMGTAQHGTQDCKDRDTARRSHHSREKRNGVKPISNVLVSRCRREEGWACFGRLALRPAPSAWGRSHLLMAHIFGRHVIFALGHNRKEET